MTLVLQIAGGIVLGGFALALLRSLGTLMFPKVHIASVTKWTGIILIVAAICVWLFTSDTFSASDFVRQGAQILGKIILVSIVLLIMSLIPQGLKERLKKQITNSPPEYFQQKIS